MHIGSIKSIRCWPLPRWRSFRHRFRMACRRQGAGLTYSKWSARRLCAIRTAVPLTSSNAAATIILCRADLRHDPEIMAKAAKSVRFDRGRNNRYQYGLSHTENRFQRGRGCACARPNWRRASSEPSSGCTGAGHGQIAKRLG